MTKILTFVFYQLRNIVFFDICDTGEYHLMTSLYRTPVNSKQCHYIFLQLYVGSGAYVNNHTTKLDQH